MSIKSSPSIISAGEWLLFASLPGLMLAGALWGVDGLGMFASIIAFALWVPQALKVWHLRHDIVAMSAVSLGTQVLLLTNALAWGLYAWGTGAFWVGAPGLVNAPLAILTGWIVLRARWRADQQRYQQIRMPGCAHCSAGQKHHVFITAPPGWGSVMECSTTTRRSGVVVTSSAEIDALRETVSV